VHVDSVRAIVCVRHSSLTRSHAGIVRDAHSHLAGVHPSLAAYLGALWSLGWTQRRAHQARKCFYQPPPPKEAAYR